MRALFSFLIVFTISICSQAMDVDDIPGLSKNTELSELKRTVSVSIEPLLKKTVQKQEPSVSPDSLRKQLNSIVKILDSMKNNESQTLLFKALMWHYLSVLDVDSAFKKCNTITKKLISSHPDLGEAVWLQSLNLIQNGEYFYGLKKLDSISSSGIVKNPDIMSDYYNFAASIFLPELNMGSESSIQLFPSARKYSLTPLDQEESLPQDQSWKSVSNKGKDKSSLTFTFGCNFLLRKEFPLNFHSWESDKLLLRLDVKKELLSKVRGPLVFDVEETPWKAEMKIVVNVSESRTSLYEYISNFGLSRFSAIKETNDASRIGGISLRCYNQVFSNVPGDYYAFITFDLPVGYYYINYSNKKKTSSGSNHIMARYLVCLKTNRCVENKAEEILQMVLSRF
jgi:hypothetical protein